MPFKNPFSHVKKSTPVRAKRKRPSRPKEKWDVEDAGDIREMMLDLVTKLDMKHIDVERVYCVRSGGSTARAYARVWGLSRIFQITAGYKATYVIEVLTQHFDKLNYEAQRKVIIHELLHIPKTFSGALLSHKGRYHRVDDVEVEKLYAMLED